MKAVRLMEETAMHRVSGVMMRLAPSGDRLGRIGRLLEEGTIRPDVATVYALQDVAQVEGHRQKPARGSRDIAR